MIKFIFLCLILLSNIALAASDEVYNTSTIQAVNSIYWLNQQQDSAIMYARWENFNSIKHFIDNAVLTGRTSQKPVNIEIADVLLLSSSKQNKMLKVYFTEDAITLNGQSYFANSAMLTKFREINMRRIAKGDLISPKVLRRVYKANN
ncbi:hypothetical protein [Cognaticolwellia beringensis]|uniref:Uncharacterized protein n=1 Tax=Cognaticolwellia beringensis TaxID=1967665 RepID=A0A222GB58_9GAMM|nr:hypothetical protein [Cognaticolwellia beringensis]ASP49031.1 hypothetical protein B5D82_15390 [Cognaticolwellia beringensis]